MTRNPATGCVRCRLYALLGPNTSSDEPSGRPNTAKSGSSTAACSSSTAAKKSRVAVKESVRVPIQISAVTFIAPP